MPRSAVLVGLVVAACNSGEGVDLEITSETSFDRVELFIATGECFENGKLCEDGVAWMPDAPRPPGDVYYMADEDNGPARLVATTKFVGDTAVMHLEATSDYRQPKLIVVVGFAADVPVAYASLPYSTRIPAHSNEVWRVKLRKADPATTSVTTPPRETEKHQRVHAWKRERVDNADELSRCLALQSWNESSQVWDGLFIVPESDPDCDGHTIECDDRHANLRTASTTSTSVCVNPVMLASAPEAVCAAGLTTCADGVSDDTTCLANAASLICLPQQLCDDCAGVGSAEGCLAYSIRTSGITHAECAFTPSTDGGGPCAQGGNATQLTLPFACEGVQAYPANEPFMGANGTTTVTVDQATINVLAGTNATNTCTVTLHWTLGTAQPGQFGWYVLVVGSVSTANTVAFPLKIEFDSDADCATITSEKAPCDVTSGFLDEPMFQCVGLQPPSP